MTDAGTREHPLESIDLRPIKPFDVSLRLPGSKSLTNRALLLAALADGTSHLSGVLFSDDTRRMIEALEALGFQVHADAQAARVQVAGHGGRIPAEQAELYLGNAGTAMRSLTAACCLGDGVYRLDGIPRMRQRPIGELVDPLRELGATVVYEGEMGYPPMTVHAKGLAGGELGMKPTLSSQFISALLMAGAGMKRGLVIRFDGPITSRPYVEMTVAMMRQFGAVVATDGDWRQVAVKPGQYQAIDLAVEPDASNASYFLAAAAVVGESRCRVEGLGTQSIQGDIGFAKVLEQMGAVVQVQREAITVASPPAGRRLRGVEVDLNRMPDMAQTLAAVALFAEGPTTIRNVGNLRVKETDRMAALQNELTKLGALVLIHGDDMTVQPPADGKIRPASIATYDDHRMAMSFAVIGLAAKGICIEDPACVNKTFPGFFEYLKKLQPGGETSA